MAGEKSDCQSCWEASCHISFEHCRLLIKTNVKLTFMVFIVRFVSRWPPVTKHKTTTTDCLSIGRSEGMYSKPCRHEKSPSKSNEVISPEILKMRAGLFCIFTYLDTKNLLRAAEVCRDWKFVARHPAVWTRVLLDNTRISSKVRRDF